MQDRFSHCEPHLDVMRGADIPAVLHSYCRDRRQAGMVHIRALSYTILWLQRRHIISQ